MFWWPLDALRWPCSLIIVAFISCFFLMSSYRTLFNNPFLLWSSYWVFSACTIFFSSFSMVRDFSWMTCYISSFSISLFLIVSAWSSIRYYSILPFFSAISRHYYITSPTRSWLSSLSGDSSSPILAIELGDLYWWSDYYLSELISLCKSNCSICWLIPWSNGLVW